MGKRADDNSILTKNTHEPVLMAVVGGSPNKDAYINVNRQIVDILFQIKPTGSLSKLVSKKLYSIIE